MKLGKSYIKDSEDLRLKISEGKPNSQFFKEAIIYIGIIFCHLVMWRMINKLSFLAREDVKETFSGGIC